ncbi:MAG: hypothetical protein KGH72_02920 [Candidatus Micrarchaeota archaeon]|nr:hypothetical protein [Candidatus Micrarchaeota archaeon]
MEAVRDRGGLPSLKLHDTSLLGTRDWKGLQRQGYYPAWTRELVVHPETGGMFVEGRDVVDAYRDSEGRRWVFPAECIPDAAIGIPKVGLFVNPAVVERDRNNVFVLADPDSVRMLTPFIQVYGQMGKVDKRTKVPLAVGPHLPNGHMDDSLRIFWRIHGPGVRPLVRGDFYVAHRRGLVASYSPDRPTGVGFTAKEEVTRKRREEESRSYSPIEDVPESVIAEAVQDYRARDDTSGIRKLVNFLRSEE